MKTVRQKTNAVKDVSGNGNRVADGATLVQEGNSPADHAHVSHSSPISLKREQLENDLQYQDAAINRTREASTSRKRANKETRPL